MDAHSDQIIDAADIGYPGMRLAVRETANGLEICGRRLTRSRSGEIEAGEIIAVIDVTTGVFREAADDDAKREVAEGLERATAWNEDRSWRPDTIALLRTQARWLAVKKLVVPYLSDNNVLDTAFVATRESDGDDA